MPEITEAQRRRYLRQYYVAVIAILVFVGIVVLAAQSKIIHF